MPDSRTRKWRLAASILLSLSTLLVANGVDPTSAFLSSTKTVSGNAFATASTFCRQPTLSFLTGFEYGQITGVGPFDTVVTTGGTPAVDSTVRRSGSYSVKLTKTGLGASSITKNLSGTVLSARFAIYLDSLPLVSAAQLATVNVSAGSAANLRYNATSSKLELAFGSSTAAVASTTAAAATWYVIDLKVDVSANPRTATWRVGGVNQTSASAAETAGSVSSLTLGSGTTADVFTTHFDDVVTASSASAYPIGSGQVLALSPNASPTSGNSGATNFQNDASGAIDANIYNRLDDVPLSSTTDFVKQVTSSSTSYVQVDFADTTSTCINGVRAMVALHAASTSANASQTRIYDGSSLTTVYNGSVGSTSLVYKSAMVTPAASTWTSTALNGLVARIGYSNDVSPVPYWDALQLEYDVSA